MISASEERADGALVSLVLAGEQELYASLIARHQERLYRFALGMVGDADAAADMVQDAFIKAFTSLASCRNPERFDAWIFRILRNRCMDYLKNVRQKNVSYDEGGIDPAGHNDPELELERTEAASCLEDALSVLPESQREAFLLKHLEDLSYEEMSEMLGVGTSALKMRVMRAREALQANLRSPNSLHRQPM